MSLLGPSWRGVRVLDAFAGSGAFGFEALSRGAASADFIELQQKTCRLLKIAAADFGVTQRVRIRKGSATAIMEELTDRGRRFDIMFFDPPYKERELVVAAMRLAGDLCARQGRVIVEHQTAVTQPDSFGTLQQTDRRIYGNTAVTIYARAQDLNFQKESL